MIGNTISHYSIIEKLGEGGMGVVYKARDTKLDRFVALKVLPADKLGSPERKRRFVQEAKSASALNHPNIVTIYEIAEADGIDFITMECVSGKTLDRLIPKRGMRVGEALEIAIQIAAALEAAHGAGIVHRDLKPSNVIAGDDGRVRVLDFGLAKLTERTAANDSDLTVSVTPDAPLTEEGTILGTANYMSPEQAQGIAVDTRSDIFSFGAVLYEMVTGRRAFQESSSVSTMAAVINQEPKPAGQLAEDLPREIERVIERCLRKEPMRRWQDITDLRIALEDLKAESDSGKLPTSAPPAPPVEKRRSLLVPVITVAAVAILLVIWFPRSASEEPSDVALRLTPLTTYSGIEEHPAFSPDGDQVVFSWNGEAQDNYDIYVKMVGSSGPPLRLTTDPARDSSPAWSPDGRQIAFLRLRDEGGSEVILTTPLGGTERKLADVQKTNSQFNVGLSWSLDGKTLAVPDRSDPAEPSGIFLLSVEGGQKQRLTSPPEEAAFGDQAPVFSPDGRRLIFERHVTWAISNIFSVPVSGGDPNQLTDLAGFPDAADWTSGGKEIVFSRKGRLWRAPAGGGSPRRLAGIGENPLQPSISAAAQRLVYVRREYETDIWRADLQSSSSPRPVRFISSTRGEENPRYSPDGRWIAFISNRSGNDEIWVCDSDGSNTLQVTTDATAGTPRWSPDGRNLVFDSTADGNQDIYMVSATGGAHRRLTSSPHADAVPSWSSDGRWIYFRSNRSGEDQIWKIPAEAVGESETAAVQVTTQGGRTPQELPDGEYVYYYRRSEGGSRGIWKVPVDGGEETPVIESVEAAALQWTVTGKGVYFVDRGESPSAEERWVVKLYSFEDQLISEVVELTYRPHGRGSGLSVSPDDRWILGAQVEISSDLMLVENFR